MDTRLSFHGSVSICFRFIIIFYLALLATGCVGGKPTTPIPISLPSPTSSPEQPTSNPTALLPVVPTPTPACTNNLAFVSDVTIPDGTVVAPGSSLDKQWLVQNSGDCNWDASYRLRFVSGNTLGASAEQALYPARAGTQATLRIQFTAPQEAGEYISEWQAFDANGIAFGESFFIKIEVQQ